MSFRTPSGLVISASSSGNLVSIFDRNALKKLLELNLHQVSSASGCGPTFATQPSPKGLRTAATSPLLEYRPSTFAEDLDERRKAAPSWKYSQRRDSVFPRFSPVENVQSIWMVVSSSSSTCAHFWSISLTTLSPLGIRPRPGLWPARKAPRQIPKYRPPPLTKLRTSEAYGFASFHAFWRSHTPLC